MTRKYITEEQRRLNSQLHRLQNAIRRRDRDPHRHTDRHELVKAARIIVYRLRMMGIDRRMPPLLEDEQ
jgi:hypothetical protein